ncbi:MAG TPA: hypothetical protein VML19_02060 [Verrucomicrobiae bacterium]|nr:hypothetical protein [Verrucomicrobiae bacterium]
MPLLRTKVAKSSDIATKFGSITFTADGIVLAHPQGNKVTIGTSGIEFSCSGSSMRMTPSEITISTGSVSFRMTMMECGLNANGPIRINGSSVNVNNGALEVV